MKRILINFLFIALAFASFKIARHFYMKPKFEQGQVPAEIETKLLSGGTFKLSDLKGRYVLLDFWGSWCGPCRAENPVLVELNTYFKDKKFNDASGFDMVSVGIENKEAQWIAAIAKDQLTWRYHILQKEGFNSPIAKAYRVREIPTKYLLGPDGKIIFVNPPLQTVADFLNAKVVIN